ncbi:3-ketosteroid-delta-1-dehydrogenase [Fictibacillus phosphorivorans]|uniref:3-ketosteroid-delta-1-dehydrogenase n=1 Tax=Fictibacillus phosphorivorans TaxID=1221500 RepID=A0A160IM18_9BACL|nr:3-ketosteroid-delta-1-dehydrogenase [Fictibacillus phosphorivorans]
MCLSVSEIRRSITGYEEQYDITSTGRIIIKRTNRARHSKGNEYGYKYVHLIKNGERKLYNTFELWHREFGKYYNESQYKGLK